MPPTMAAGRRRWWALGALAVSSLVVGLDLTVLNLALPTLAVSLHITSGGMLQWFVVSYSLVFAAMLLPGGLLGDRYGRKRLLIVALVVFGARLAGLRLLRLGGAVHRRPRVSRASAPPSSCRCRSRSSPCCSPKTSASGRSPS